MSDIKLAYATHTAVTITLASLASSATFVAGRESTEIDNTTNKYLDYLLGGRVKVGDVGVTAGEIRIYVAARLDDAPVWPDVLDGTDSAETITSTDILNVALRLAAVMPTNTTVDRSYYFGPISIASLFGGVCPDKFVVFVTHNTTDAISGTEADHGIWYQGIYETVA